jgi:hypothetical protein
MSKRQLQTQFSQQIKQEEERALAPSLFALKQDQARQLREHQKQQQAAAASAPSSPTLSSGSASGSSSKKRASTSSASGREAVLARKAELARQSRKRKKLYIQDLQEKVKILGRRVEELQAAQKTADEQRRDANLTEAEKRRREEHEQVRAQLHRIVQQVGEAETAAAARPGTDAKAAMAAGAAVVDEREVNALLDRTMKNSQDRQAQIAFYLSKVEECLTPAAPAKFVLWGLDQPDEFYTKPGLWQTLMINEMNVSEEQIKAILEQREAVHGERQALRQSVAMMSALRKLATEHIENLHRQMAELRTVLSCAFFSCALFCLLRLFCFGLLSFTLLYFCVFLFLLCLFSLFFSSTSSAGQVSCVDRQ